MRLLSLTTLTLSCCTWSCRWLFWSSTPSSCVKYVVERPATPPAISDSNVTGQPRPTRPCLPSCWSPLRSSTFCCAASGPSSTWHTGPRAQSANMPCIRTTGLLTLCCCLFTPTTSTCTWSQANSFVQNYRNSSVVAALPLLLLLFLLHLLLLMMICESQDTAKRTQLSETSYNDVEPTDIHRRTITITILQLTTICRISCLLCLTVVVPTEAALIDNNEASAKLTIANGGTFTWAQLDSVANHVTARSIGDWLALPWLATATGWTRLKRSAICSGKLIVSTWFDRTYE